MELTTSPSNAPAPADPASLQPAPAGPISADPMPRHDRRTWWATLFALCALLGAMLGLSVKTQNVKTHQDEAAKQQGTVVMAQANLDLQRRIAQLQKDNARLATAAPSDTGRLKELSRDLAKAQAQAGLTDVTGPGVVATMDDSHRPVAKDMKDLPPAVFGGGPPPNLIHDTDIGQVVNELKAAGAEAISVNGQRLVAVSPIRCAGPTIYVNNTPQTPPYVIKAIGDSKTLYAALNMTGGVTTLIKAYDPAMFLVQKAAKPLLIPAYSGGIDPKYAKPAVPDAGAATARAAVAHK